MRKILITVLFWIFGLLFTDTSTAQAQNVGIGTNAPDNSAMLDIVSTSRGILIPRMTSAQRTAVSTPARGLLVYDLDTKSFWFYDGSWTELKGGGNTLDQAYDEGGAGSGRVITADNGAVLIAGTDGFQVTGTHGSGATLALSGAGSRMFFYPRKSAFRAGYSAASEWNDANIGVYSVALGYRPKASGLKSIAFGDSSLSLGEAGIAIGTRNRALSYRSLAMGNYSLASDTSSLAIGYRDSVTGKYASAFGYNNTATADYGVAIGYNSKSTGSYSTAMGMGESSGNYSISIGGTAQGDNSLAMNSGFAVGKESVAMGYGSRALSYRSLAMGNYSLASDTSSLAIGYRDSVTGKYASAFGYKNTATGNYATAMGYNSQATGVLSMALNATSNGNSAFAAGFGRADGMNSMALGYAARADSAYAVAIGNGSRSSGQYAFSIGKYCTSSGYGAFSIGDAAEARGLRSYAIGVDVRAYSAYEFVIGTENTSYAPSSATAWSSLDRLFVIGNGTPGLRSDAMVVLKNGNVGIGTSIPANKLEVAGKIKTTTLQISSGAASGYLLQSDVNGNASWISPSSLSDNDWTVNGNNMYSSVTGNVGIGTSTPGAKLDVDGSATFNESGAAVNFRIESNTRTHAFFLDGNNDFIGMGSSSPGADLHILQSSALSSRGLRLEYNSGGNYWTTYIDGADDYNFSYNGTLKSYILDLDGSYVTASDRRLKKDIRPLGRTLDKVMNLNAYRYRFIGSEQAAFSYGLMAQEVELQFPELIHMKNGYKMLAYDQFVPILLESVKELNEKVQSLEQRIAQLERMMQEQH